MAESGTPLDSKKNTAVAAVKLKLLSSYIFKMLMNYIAASSLKPTHIALAARPPKLPTETWTMIFSYLPVADIKAV